VDDGEGGSTEAQLPVVTANVAPTLALAEAVNAVEDDLYELTLGQINDLGADAATQWMVVWGDGRLVGPNSLLSWPEVFG
jgi:hypothetical protein